ncbi:SpaA isopeptide-forming pilin-related protein [Lactococcus allomyrinae]|uniref:SpaA-like prealbumin fold domain-containing protein n=1 Tax=Lactococcus allomyrinae TaxID=2419773 RepID=A0A387BBA3_9LACT|nr:SpaA isopeptide-forming pilin-related protein [Lactococcus allomyrinae]AYG01155.1 hypothetical protein D7I46_08630 [Lactococcus allomyrinae]
MVETGIAKLDADTLGASTNGIPNLSGGEFTLEDSKGNVIKQSQGLNPQTGAQANVALSSGAQYAPDANGNIVLVTNAQGSAGFVYNIDLPTADGLQWVETKAPNGFAINDNPVTITFDSSNAIDNTTNNVEDNKANSSTISDQPLLEATLDKDSTNAEFNHVLGKAVYELQTQAGVPIKQAQGLDPKTGDSANIVVVTGTFVSNTAGNLDVQATADGLIDVKNIDGTLVPKDVQWVELSPADGHALNNVPAQTSFDKGTYSSDASNFLAVSKTTDKPMGETAIAKCDADTGDNTTQGAATLQGAEFTLEDLTGTPIKQTQGVDPQTGAQANVVLAAGTSYAPDANGNIVVVTNAQGIGGQVQNIDLSNNLNYQWVETKAPYGYTINTKPIEVDFSASNEVDSNTNNYKDGLKLGATISDRVVDFDFAFIKAATDNGATGLNGAEFTLTPLTGTLNALGQYDNGKDTNINGQDTYINPDTGLATPVTDVSQLYLGAVQTSHDYTDPQGGQSAGWVEYDHVQVGKYKVSETKVPDGETQAHDLEVDILPDTTTDGAPTSYEFKVIDLVTKNVLRDVTIPVSYSPTQDGRQLLNDNNFLGKFNLGSIFDSPTTPPTPSIDVEKANDAMPTAGKGNDTDSNNNAGPNDHDTAATADVLKEGATTPIDFLFTNNGTDDLTQLKPVDKTTNGSISVKDITYTYNGTTLSLNADGYLTNADGSLFVLPAGQAIQATGTLPALPVGELHTDEVNINAVGVKSGTPVHDHDDWNGIVPKPSIDIEKANGSIPNAGNGNHTDKANNAGANDHDTVATLDPIKAGTSTAIYFRGTNNGTEALSHIKVSDTTTDGSVSIGSIVWTYQGQTLKINASGELTLQDGTLLTLQPKDTITGEGTLPALPAGELHGDDVTISGIGVLDNKSVGDDDKWYGEVTPHDSIDIEKANDTMPKAGNGNNTDKANNVGTNDHDTAATADDLKVGATTPIYFRITNNGNEALTQVTPVDKTIEGTATLSAITWTYNGQKLTLSKDGAFVTTDGKLLVLPVGGTVTGAATLAALGTDQTTADEASVTGVGVNSHNKVGDKDDWYGKTQKLTVVPPQTPSAPKSNVYNIIIPDTGTALGQFQLVGYIIIALVIGNVVYYIVKKRRNKEDEAA